MSGKVKQYAEFLGLTGQITFVDVKKAYRREMQKWHPDLHNGKDTAPQAHKKAQAINEAYEFLSELTEEQPIHVIETPKTKAYDQYTTRHTYQQRNFRPGFPDPSVFEVFVKSSWVISVGYNQLTRMLYLKLVRGSIYRCFEVPRSVFDSLLDAESIGRYVNQFVWCFRHEAC